MCPHNVWGEKALLLHFLRRWVFPTSRSPRSPAWLPLNITDSILAGPLAAYSLVLAEDVDTAVCSLCGAHATRGFSGVDCDPSDEPWHWGRSGWVGAGGGLFQSLVLREGSQGISAEAEEPLGKEGIQCCCLWFRQLLDLRIPHPSLRS